MLTAFKLNTQRENFYNITQQVRCAVADSGVQNGICVVYCPHTTAGITINENAEPGWLCTNMHVWAGQGFSGRKAFYTWRATLRRI